MPIRRRREIVIILRERLERALGMRALVRGDRLPSTREMGAELNADPRVVAAAYRELADEGLVELRPRSGTYVSRQMIDTPVEQSLPREWVVEVLTGAIMRGFSTRDLCDLLREAALGRRINVAVIGTTYDQTAGICRELRDFNLECASVLIEALKSSSPLPNAVRRAHLMVTHEENGVLVKRLASRLGKPAIVATVRQGIISDEWLLLLEREVFFIATDQRFVNLLRGYLASTPGAENVRTLIAGRDDLSVIPPDAPTYVTQAARELIGKTRIPGRLIRTAPLLSEDCVRAILDFIVGMNRAEI